MKLADQLADDRESSIGVDEVHPFDDAHRVTLVTAEQGGDERRQPARHLSAQWVGHTNEKHPIGSHATHNLEEWS